ncbi:hypothetical protein D3C77_588370 [compost metagenome]
MASARASTAVRRSVQSAATWAMSAPSGYQALSQTMAPLPKGRGRIALSQLFSRMAGRHDRPMNSTGAPEILAIIGKPSAICRAGPRGPSGVTARPPTLSCFSPSRSACVPPLDWAALFFLAEEPRTAGMPRRPTALAKNSPSALSDTRPLTG